MVVRRRSAASCGCRPKPNGRKRRAAASRVGDTRGATTSIRRAATSSPIRRSSVSAARGRPARIRRTRTACTTSSGNVWEWVSDWYGGDYYSVGEARDPRGPESGNMRIVRGGSWVNEDVVDAAVRVSAQGAARHVRVQHRIQNRMRSVIVPLAVLRRAGRAAARAGDRRLEPPTPVDRHDGRSRRAPRARSSPSSRVAVESRAKNPRDAQRQNAEAMTAVQQRLAGCRRAEGRDADARLATRSRSSTTCNGRRVAREFVARNAARGARRRGRARRRDRSTPSSRLARRRSAASGST